LSGNEYDRIGIPDEQLNEGIRLCARNANRYLRDAELLYRNRSYGHALAMSILALEEHGRKILMIALKKKLTSVDKDLWKMMFRDHTQKIAMTFNIFTHALKHSPSEHELKEIYTGLPKVDLMKQRGLYVDYFRGAWHSPFDQDVKKRARSFISWVKTVIKDADSWLSF
jgi:AbiV family abortive infection protein